MARRKSLFELRVSAHLYTSLLILMHTKPLDFIQSPTPNRRRTGRQQQATTKTTEDATADIATPPAPTACNRRCQNDPAPAAAPTAEPTIVPAADPPDANDPAPGPVPTPVCDEAANPFLAAEPQADAPLQNPGSPAPTERQFHMATPSTIARTPHHPQAGRHSTSRAHPRPPSDGPAGRKHQHSASDVWTFFKETTGKNICVFCKYVW
jgi:hypothetical protein